jgi:hypothetical protein
MVVILSAVALFFFILFVLSLTLVVFLWRSRTEKTREPFALAALAAIVTLSLALISAIGSNSTPWAMLISAISFIITRQPFSLPTLQLLDYAFLGLVGTMTIAAILIMYRQWYQYKGLQSLREFQREQEGLSASMITEGSAELVRLVRRQSAFPVHSKEDPLLFIKPLNPVKDSLSWKDIAQELLRLSSSSYTFDTETGWHDRAGYWVGRNVDNNDPVILYPAYPPLSDSMIEDFVTYAARVIHESGRETGELIIAVQHSSVQPISSWKGFPIRWLSEESLLNSLVKFTDYFNDIRRRVSTNTLADSRLTIEQVYVEPRCRTSEGTIVNLETYIEDWLAEPGQRHLALLGDYGQGKSTSSLMLSYRMLRPTASKFGRIPLLIELRGTSPRNLSPLDFLGAWSAKYNLSARALMRLLVAGRLLVIFEGFDEMAMIGDAEMRLKHFETLWQFAFPRAKIIITGRPNFFLDDIELKRALGISYPMVDRPYCEPLWLELFNHEQISTSLRSHEPFVRQQITELVMRNPRFSELVSRPSLLYIVSILWKRAHLAEKAALLNSAEVMGLFVQNSYLRQGLKAKGSPEFMALTTGEREYFMSGIATYMAGMNLSQIRAQQLNLVIDKLIAKIPDSVTSAKSTAIIGETDVPLRIRLQGEDSNNRIEHVKTDVRACGLLVDDPTSPNAFRFGHKSFQEYLFASIIHDRLQDHPTPEARTILAATGVGIDSIASQPVSLDFLEEMMETEWRQKSPPSTTSEATTRLRAESALATQLLHAILSEKYVFLISLRVLVFAYLVFVFTGQKANRILERFTNWIIKHLPPRNLERRQILSRRDVILELSSASPNVRTQSFVVTLLLIIAAVAMVVLAVWRDSSSNASQVSLSDSLPGLVFSMAFVMVPVIGSILLFFIRKKLSLWANICQKLAANKLSMHRAVGTALFPWFRNEAFPSFTEEDSFGGLISEALSQIKSTIR